MRYQWNFCKCNRFRFGFPHNGWNICIHLGVDFLSDPAKPVIIRFIIDVMFRQPLLDGCAFGAVIALFNNVFLVRQANLMSNLIHVGPPLKNLTSFLSFLKFATDHLKSLGGWFDVYQNQKLGKL